VAAQPPPPRQAGSRRARRPAEAARALAADRTSRFDDPVGSTIVAEVLIGLVRRSDDSILGTAGWTPTLPADTPGRFELADLLRFAKVLPATTPSP
jgi:hypothetical protein